LIPLADVELWRELGLIYRRNRTLPRSATAFITLIRQRAAAESDAGRPRRR
jgi:DNA-binding transcriptional LysR family regulator